LFVLLAAAAIIVVPSVIAQNEDPPETPKTNGSELPFEPDKWSPKNADPELASVLRDVQLQNNCYNYACNKKNNNTAITGGSDPEGKKKVQDKINAASKKVFRPNNFELKDYCELVKAGAIADGANEKDCTAACPKGSVKKMMFAGKFIGTTTAVKPHPQAGLSSTKGWVDYHWYVQNLDGTFSHKQGKTPPTNLDSSDNSITDPRTADRSFDNTITNPDFPNLIRKDTGTYSELCGCFCCDDTVIKK